MVYQVAAHQIEVQVTELDNKRYLIEVEGHPEALGPFTQRELIALLSELYEWYKELRG